MRGFSARYRCSRSGMPLATAHSVSPARLQGSLRISVRTVYRPLYAPYAPGVGLLIMGEPLVNVRGHGRRRCCLHRWWYWSRGLQHLGGAAMGAPDPDIQASGRPPPGAAPGARSSASTSRAASEGARSAVGNDQRYSCVPLVDMPHGHTAQRLG